MYRDSTQKKHWMFSSIERVHEVRKEALKKYISNVETGDEKLLGYDEESMLLDHFADCLMKMCGKFAPVPPPTVFASSLTYFRRFYMTTSVMDFHPKEISILCLYMAFKVEEYNVPIAQFLNTVSPNDCERIGEFIISHELILLQKLDFQLTVHSPFRALEGFMIDIKRSCNETETLEKSRAKIESYLYKSCKTYAIFLYPPSQISLAGIHHCVGAMIVMQYLSKSSPDPELITQKLQSISTLISSYQSPAAKSIKSLLSRLEECRNHVNNPYSVNYQQNNHNTDELDENMYNEEKQRALNEGDSTVSKLLESEQSM